MLTAAQLGAHLQTATQLFAWTNDWQAAEDLTQETFLRLWSHRGTIDWERPLLPWLVVTGRRLANNRFRSLRRRLGAIGDPARSNEGAVVRWLDVRAAFARLTAIERAAIVLTALEGHSYSEAAQMLSTTDGALRSAVSRARQKLGED